MKGFKERRREPRERFCKQVVVTNLAQLNLPFPGRAVDSSESGLRLTLATPLEAGASLAIEWDDTCVLADVVYCVGNGDSFLVGVRTNYVILDRTHSCNESTPEM